MSGPPYALPPDDTTRFVIGWLAGGPLVAGLVGEEYGVSEDFDRDTLWIFRFEE